MAVMSVQMKTNDRIETRRMAASASELPSVGWNDSSWELLRGLDVAEVPLDAWPDGDLPTQPAALS
jgi:hypothetical protein